MNLPHSKENCHQNQKVSKKTKENRYKKKQNAIRNKNKEKFLRKLSKKEKRAQKKLEKERSSVNTLAQKLIDFMGYEGIEKVARSTGYLIRKAKLMPLAFLITLSFATYGTEGKLVSLTRYLSKWFNIQVDVQSISDRLNEKKTVKFLKAIFSQTLDFQFNEAFKNKYSEIFKMFTGVILEDSTRFELPEHVAGYFKGSGGGASSAAMKLDFTYDICSNAINNIEVTSASTSDKTLGKKIIQHLKAGALYIRDLGYFDLSIIQKIIDKSAYFLSRLQKDVNIYMESTSKEPICINEFLRKSTENGNTVDQIMYVSNKKIPLRLIAEKVPEEVKAQRAKRYKSERKKEPTEDYVTWNGFSVFITNIPKEMILSSCLIITIYKVRWNIELFFKRLKSIAKINIIKVESKNGVLCMVYAKLIGILLGEVIISYAASICDEGEELSEYKMTDWLQEGNTLGIAVKDGTWEELLVEMIRIFYLHCKDKRIKRKSLQKEVEDALQWESNETDNSELVA